MKRDFTYIDDVIEGVVRVLDRVPQLNSTRSETELDSDNITAPYKIYNIGNNQPNELIHFIEVLEDCLGIKAKKNLLPMQPGDVPVTYADVDPLIEDVGFKPNTPIEVGIEQFVKWYQSYYQIPSASHKWVA
jgi:UDP-glucuronate 4-epimerase